MEARILGSLISSSIVEISKLVFSRVERHVKYLFCYGQTAEKLKEQVQRMVPHKASIQQRVDAAREEGDTTLHDVEQWLGDFQKLESEANDISDGVQQVGRCYLCCCWNPHSGYQLAKKAAKKMDEVERLWSSREFQIVSIRGPTPGIESRLPTHGFQIFSSTKVCMEELLEFLREDGNYIIGVYGMGGVGKTTLVKEVAKKAKNDGLFMNVVMATVSQNPDVKKIQKEIAEGLGLKLEEESESIRAGKILEKLKMLHNLLIILDDLWDNLVLTDVGIPSEAENVGCKVVITSRARNVCSRMESHCIVEVKMLSPEDSWTLFKSKVGEVLEISGLEKLARDVAKECKGLPLALLILGLAMRGRQDRNEWEAVLEELQSSAFIHIEGMERKVFQSIRKSIDFLNGEEKICFLFCCLFSEDLQIDPKDLAFYVMGEGLLRNIHSLRDAERKVLLILNKLKNSCLLLEGRDNRCVMMHDIVRDVAIYVASDTTFGFLAEARKGLTSWPERMEASACLRISLMDNKINALPENLRCEKLQTLTLGGNENLTEVPDNFFQEMESLLVLDLSRVSISCLPISLPRLVHLKTLLITGTRNISLTDISLIGELKELEILRLRNISSLSVLPEQIGNLKRLVYLDLGGCYNMKILPGILPRLSRLEQLDIRAGFREWQVEGSGDTNVASFSELACLPCLTHLFIVASKECLAQNLIPFPWPMLKAFDIIHTNSWKTSGEVGEETRTLTIVKPVSNWAKELLSGVKELTLLDWDGAECIITGVERDIPRRTFSNLEAMELINMPQLKNITKEPLSDGSLQKLKVLTIQKCHELMNVLSTADIISWTHGLEQLRIYSCGKVREVFHYDNWMVARGGQAVVSELLPKLRYLYLADLPELTCIWDGVVPEGCRLLLNLKDLEISNCHRLKRIVLPSQVFEQLEKLSISSCDQLEKIVSTEYNDQYYMAGSADGYETEFPPSSMIYSSAAFSNLRILSVLFCPRITSLLSWKQAAQGFPQLEELRVECCDALKEVITPEGEEEVQALDVAAQVVLPRLQKLDLAGLRLLRSLHPEGMPSIMLPSLKNLKVLYCRALKKLPFQIESSPNLERIDGDEEWFQGLQWEDESIRQRLQRIFHPEVRKRGFITQASILAYLGY